MIADLVRCTPGARTNWHSHAAEQTLIITRDGTVIRMRPGGTVYTPPGEEHRHGATARSMMCHLTMLEGTGDSDVIGAARRCWVERLRNGVLLHGVKGR